jgi:hypothetical protein
MVDRYKPSLGVPVAPVARPRESGQAQIAEAVGGLANQALGIAQKKLEERTASLEAASLNSARIELEKRGGEMALELQKDRIAGTDYVKDLEKARTSLKDEVWGKLPGRVQNSARARMAFDDIWTSDQIQATRSATAWQAGQEKNFSIRSLNDFLTVSSARLEANPDGMKAELEAWSAEVPKQAGLVDAETLAEARTKGVQAILQGTVRGLAKQARFDEANKLLADAAAQLDPVQRKAFEAVIEDAKNDIEREKNRQEVELNKTQRLNANRMEIDILDGKAGRRQIDAGVESGDISENDAPTLIRAHRAEQDRLEREAKLSDAYKAEWADWSLDAQQQLSTMPGSIWVSDIEEWPPQAKQLYDNMDRDRQRAVRQKQLDMREKGQTQDTAMGVYRDLVGRAKRLVPDWKLTTESVMGEGEGLEFSGRLFNLAKRYAAENPDKAIPEKDAREIVARALNAQSPPKPGMFGTDGYPLPPDLILKDMTSRYAKDVDMDLLGRVNSQLAARLGRPPTQAELTAAYDKVQAQ